MVGAVARRSSSLGAKMADTGQKFIKRNRPPRVHITYEDPYDAEVKVELPFVMGVMADLSGNTPGVEKADFADRKFLEFDMDNFENRMASIAPGSTFRVDNVLASDDKEKLSVQLNFKKMDDFSPAAVARQVPSAEQTPRGSRATHQPLALHGRQSGSERSDQGSAQGSAVDGGLEGKARRRSEGRGIVYLVPRDAGTFPFFQSTLKGRLHVFRTRGLFQPDDRSSDH